MNRGFIAVDKQGTRTYDKDPSVDYIQCKKLHTSETDNSVCAGTGRLDSIESFLKNPVTRVEGKNVFVRICSIAGTQRLQVYKSEKDGWSWLTKKTRWKLDGIIKEGVHSFGSGRDYIKAAYLALNGEEDCIDRSFHVASCMDANTSSDYDIFWFKEVN